MVKILSAICAVVIIASCAGAAAAYWMPRSNEQILADRITQLEINNQNVAIVLTELKSIQDEVVAWSEMISESDDLIAVGFGDIYDMQEKIKEMQAMFDQHVAATEHTKP